MKILVTGGQGLVGSQIVHSLKRSGKNVLSPTRQELDLLNTKSIVEFLSREKPDLLIHSAWYTAHGKFWNALENEDWRMASLKLAENFYQNGGRKFFGLGTCAEYQWDDSTICEEDRTCLNPATLYGQKKLQFQKELKELASRFQRKALWGRVFFPYGPGEKPTRVLPLMIQAFVHEKPVQLSSGLQKRDFLFTEDLGDLIAGLGLSEAEGEFNLSSGEAVSIRNLGEVLSQVSGKPLELLKFSSEPLKEPLLIVGSTAKRDQVFPWKPRHTLAQGLVKTLNWWVKIDGSR